MSEDLSPRDVLIGIGANLLPNRRGFRCSEAQFHGFLYHRQERFPDIFRGFMFDTNGNYPFYEALDEVRSSLVLSGVLNSPPVGHIGYYQFDPGVVGCYEEIRGKINDRQARDLAAIAQEFDRELGEENRFEITK